MGKITTVIVEWVDVSVNLPTCDKRKNSFGRPVLIFPPHKSAGTSDAHTAFYGCRVTDKPNFYLYGAVIHPKLWAEIPKPPRLMEILAKKGNP